MGWYEAIKDGISVAQKADNLELVRGLVDAQKEIMDLIEDNRGLRDRIRKLEEAMQLKAALKFRDNQYWLERPGQEPDGPYCTTCYDVDKNLVRMHKARNSASGWTFCDWCTYRRNPSKK